MLTSMVPDFFLRVSISRVVPLWVFFIVSISLFRYLIVLFNSIACLIVFSCNSLRNFCVSFLRTSTCLAVFSFFLALQVCWGIQDSLCWEYWDLMMQVVLVFVSKILMFAFHHLVISGVSCYSLLWLELVPLVILLASISRPGTLGLSWVSVVRALSAGKFSSYMEGAQISGSLLCKWRSCLHRVLWTLKLRRKLVSQVYW